MMGISLHDIERKYAAVDAAEAQSGPTPQAEAQRLIKAKEAIESQLDACYSVLSVNHTDLTSPLTDASGFPRDDIPDLASVRTARARIHELRNDLRANMDALKSAMELIFAKGEAAAGDRDFAMIDPGSPSPSAPQPPTRSTTMTPFAYVNSVAGSSPAEAAGLQRDDRIVRFGGVNATNYDKLAAVGALVRDSEGEQLQIVVMRGPPDSQQMTSLSLTPRSGWGGRGLLGCHIMPL